MFRTLQSRLVLSHILPLVIVIPLMYVSLSYLFETRLLLPRLAQNLVGDARLLTEIAGLVRGEGFEIGNVAVQVIGNRPRLLPRRAESEALLSRTLGCPVSVSGKTTDGLGMTGRGEGVAAIATALIVRV